MSQIFEAFLDFFCLVFGNRQAVFDKHERRRMEAACHRRARARSRGQAEP